MAEQKAKKSKKPKVSPKVKTFGKEAPKNSRKVKGYVDVDGFFAFKEGDCLTGIFVGMETGKYGSVPIVSQDGKRFGLPTHQALVGALGQVDVGKMVEIRCLGKVPTRSGNEFMDYEVYELGTED